MSFNYFIINILKLNLQTQMNKFIVLAAFLGFTLGNDLDFWTEGAPTGMGYTWAKNIVNNEWFTATTFSEVDFGFGTLYQNIFNDASPSTTVKGHQYGVHLYSYGRQSMVVEALKNYKYIVDVQVEPVYVAPYVQTVSWTVPRPKDTATPFKFAVSAYRYADLLNYNTYNGENIKVMEHSLYDALFNNGELLPETSEFGYNEEYYADWHDTKFSGNLLQKFLEQTHTDLHANLLGMHEYYNKQF